MLDIQKLREDTPGCGHCVHFDNASAGLMPRPVLDAMLEHLNRESRFGGYQSADDAADAVHEVYALVARLTGALPGNIALVENATAAFFQALSGFDFQPGDIIVTTRNDYISNQLAYLSLAQRRGVEVRRAADLASGGADPQSVREFLRHPRVRLLAVTWVPTNSGLIQPVEALGEIAEATGVPYLIDACQAVGQLPVDVQRLRCDFLCASARKFLRGPRGIGFLYVSGRALNRGHCPLYIDMRAAEWVTADTYQVAPDARRFENWEFAYSLVLGLGEAVRYARAVGVEAGGERARQLAAAIRDELRDVPGFRVLDRGKELAAIVTVEVAGRQATDLVRSLRDRKINTSATFREWAILDMDDKHATSAVRISPHYYNTEEEVATVVEALKEASL
jgi:selenocysteine lyase/cysteine desulfurase